jgi:hypothetical protein
LSSSYRRIILHLVLWTGVLAFWVFFTRSHHPTLIVAAVATMLLVSACALAVYVNVLWLMPKFAKRRFWVQYLAGLLAVVAALDLIAVLSIQLAYDLLGVAREGRYGFWFNMAADGSGIILHIIASVFLMWIAKYFRKGAMGRAVRG